MYLSQEAIHRAIVDLENVQPFYGITFLVCKKHELPIGETIPFAISYEETRFLNLHYKPLQDTVYYFRVFRTSEKSKFWLEPDYSSTGSQSNRTQKFGSAFLHPKKSNLWGWSKDYLTVLSDNLQNDKPIPLVSLAIWLYRDIDWDLSLLNAEVVANTFIEEFNLTRDEIEQLFYISLPTEYIGDNLWSEAKYEWRVLRSYFSVPLPSDSPAERIKSLLYIKTENVGPAATLELILNERLNIITGDNGLGKSFILETIWWALTGTWTKEPLYPNAVNKTTTISYEIEGNNGSVEFNSGFYNRTKLNWQKSDSGSNEKGLVIFAGADGMFAVMDPLRPVYSINSDDNKPLIFSKNEIWNGLKDNDNDLSGRKDITNFLCNGIIIDWANWQQSNSEVFDLFKKVLRRLSPPLLGDLGILEPGALVRIPRDSRLIPTVKHNYGEVPILFTSEAVKRILAFAYLIVWTWQEHLVNSRSVQETFLNNLVIIIDEIELHLHPQWQRTILPALLDVAKDLNKNLSVQFILTTHSPLVIGSIENIFNEERDKLLHFNIVNHEHRDHRVIIEDIYFHKRGTVDSWLTSDIFELKQPRNLQAEKVINRAINLQLDEDVTKDKVLAITEELKGVLPEHDTFWVRWRAFANKYQILI